MEAVLGAFFGGLWRMAPELLKFFDRKGERAHEIALGSQQLELIKAQGQTRIEEVNAQADAARAAGALDAFREAVKAQGTPTGIKWVDAASAFVRPYWTYLVLNTWVAVKLVNVWAALLHNLTWAEVRPILWTADDVGMLSTLATFWFLDRVLVKQAK